MSVGVVLAIGLMATFCMFGIQALAEHVGLVRGNAVRAIGSFAIPGSYRNHAVEAVLHAVAGLAFTGVYAYIFNFVQLSQVSQYVLVGGAIGLVHAFLVSFLSVLCFPDTVEDRRPELFAGRSIALNLVAHVVFGALLGAGFGFEILGHAGLWLVAYAGATCVVLWALVLLIVPRQPLFVRFKDKVKYL